MKKGKFCNPLKQAQTCPSMPKDGKTKISVNQKYINITNSCLTNHALDDLTVSEISLIMLKRTCMPLPQVTICASGQTPHVGSFYKVNALCRCILYKSGVFLQHFLRSLKI